MSHLAQCLYAKILCAKTLRAEKLVINPALKKPPKSGEESVASWHSKFDEQAYVT